MPLASKKKGPKVAASACHLTKKGPGRDGWPRLARTAWTIREREEPPLNFPGAESMERALPRQFNNSQRDRCCKDDASANRGCLGPLEALEALTSLDQRLLSAVWGGGTAPLTLPQPSRPVTGRRQSIAIGCRPCALWRLPHATFSDRHRGPQQHRERPMFSPSHSAQTYNRHFHEERPLFCKHALPLWHA